MKQQLKLIFKMQRLLKHQAKRLGFHDYDCKLIGLNEAFTSNPKIDCNPNGEPYHYPETLEVKFENWSNNFYSLRTSDSGWIRSGRNMMTIHPESTFKVVRNQIREMKLCMQHRQQNKANKGA